MEASSIAQNIVGWRADYLTMFDNRHRAALLCYAYNWATNPTAHRTDREHRACKHFARVVRRRLARLGAAWHESENGRLFPEWRIAPAALREIDERNAI